MRCLLVEDETMVRLMIEDMLQAGPSGHGRSFQNWMRIEGGRDG